MVLYERNGSGRYGQSVRIVGAGEIGDKLHQLIICAVERKILVERIGVQGTIGFPVSVPPETTPFCLQLVTK